MSCFRKTGESPFALQLRTGSLGLRTSNEQESKKGFADVYTACRPSKDLTSGVTHKRRFDSHEKTSSR